MDYYPIINTRAPIKLTFFLFCASAVSGAFAEEFFHKHNWLWFIGSAALGLLLFYLCIRSFVVTTKVTSAVWRANFGE